MNKVILKHLSFIWLIILSILSLYIFVDYNNFIVGHIFHLKNYVFHNYSIEKIGNVELFNYQISFENVIYSSIFLFICGYFYISKFFTANKYLINSSKFLFIYFIISLSYVHLAYYFDIYNMGDSITRCYSKYLFFFFSRKYNFLLIFLSSISAVIVYILKDKNISETKLNKYTLVGIFTYVIAIASIPSFLFVDYCLACASSRTIVSLSAGNITLREVDGVNPVAFNKNGEIKFVKHLVYSMNKKNKWNIHVEDIESKKSFDFEFMTTDKSKDVFVKVEKLDNHIVIACKEGIYYFNLDDVPEGGKFFCKDSFNEYLKDEYSLIPGDIEMFYRNDGELHIMYVAGRKNIYIDHYIVTQRGLEPNCVHVFNKSKKSSGYSVGLDSKHNPHLLYIVTKDKNYVYDIHH